MRWLEERRSRLRSSPAAHAPVFRRPARGHFIERKIRPPPKLATAPSRLFHSYDLVAERREGERPGSRPLRSVHSASAPALPFASSSSSTVVLATGWQEGKKTKKRTHGLSAFFVLLLRSFFFVCFLAVAGTSSAAFFCFFLCVSWPLLLAALVLLFALPPLASSLAVRGTFFISASQECQLCGPAASPFFFAPRERRKERERDTFLLTVLFPPSLPCPVEPPARRWPGLAYRTPLRERSQRSTTAETILLLGLLYATPVLSSGTAESKQNETDERRIKGLERAI